MEEVALVVDSPEMVASFMELLSIDKFSWWCFFGWKGQLLSFGILMEEMVNEKEEQSQG
uniref:TPSI1 n=1 Tax=Solanum lycopersicum TaxID=4081 RepID=Q41336_SOLLC|nr:TPSI1 [Solanum lycopersicum]CAA67602.1 TPSI1 [Solanum lycopersicum]